MKNLDEQWKRWPRAKELKTCLSPPMRVANKLTPETKSKMAEKTPERTGREQRAEKMLELADEGS